jgi:hypothetical protein
VSLAFKKIKLQLELFLYNVISIYWCTCSKILKSIIEEKNIQNPFEDLCIQCFEKKKHLQLLEIF